jgi:hypothetical protein
VLDSFGIRTYGCRGCHTDLTDSIRAHLYGCAMLPVEVRRRAQAAREAARSLVKQSAQQHLRSIAQLVQRLKRRFTRCVTQYGRDRPAAGPSSQGGRSG